MMLLRGLHPTFDALSAHADLSDVDAARTRVGRHVASCARCRETVSDIHALGDAARAMEVHGAPAGLRARIEAAAQEAPSPAPAPARETPPPDDDVYRPAPSLRPTRTVDFPRPSRAALLRWGAAALAAGVVLALAWPRPSALQAAAPSRLTFSPARPVPGGLVRIRYRAPASIGDARGLIVVGRFARPAGSYAEPFGGSMRASLGDSLAELTPDVDGSLVATIRLPRDFLAASIAVADPRRDQLHVDGPTPWLIVGGTPEGAPSLAALLAALELRQSATFGDGARGARQSVDVADSLRRHFPRHPAGWAYSRTYGVSKGRFDYRRFFDSAERRYAAMYEALWPQRGLDAERLHDMVVFARTISEPAEEMRWATRLAEEHPEDPRALLDLADALHQLELREPPTLRDSIRRWLPALDRAYRAAPVPNRGFEDALRLARSYGDPATYALWRSREAANGAFGNIWMLTRRPDGDSVMAELRARAGFTCELPAGRWPTWDTVGGWRRQCEMHRGMAYGALSARSIARGEHRRALHEADSAIAAMRRGEFCFPSRGYVDHGLASLALGDTATAARDLALASAGYPTGNRYVLDSLTVRLGARFDSARFAAVADSARLAARACLDLARERNRVKVVRGGE